MYEVFHKDWPTSMSSYFLTLEEAQDKVARTTGGKNVDGVHVEMVGSDFLGIREVERESKPCRFCGGQVESDNPETDYCRSCYYSGRTQEGGVEGILALLRSRDEIDPESVGVWHTGGGCFCVGAMTRDALPLQILMAHEASVDDLPSEETPWGIWVDDAEGNDDGLGNDEDQLIVHVDQIVPLLVDMLERYRAGERTS